METASTVNSQNSVRIQVARSKGTEWMVSSYNAWQQRSPLPDMPKSNTSYVMPLIRRMVKKEKQFNSVMSVSYRSVLFILALIMSVKSR